MSANIFNKLNAILSGNSKPIRRKPTPLRTESLEDRRMFCTVNTPLDLAVIPLGTNTLRSCIADSTVGAIDFSVANVAVSLGEIPIDRDLVINGGLTSGGKVTIDGSTNANRRLFNINDGVLQGGGITVTIENATIQNFTQVGNGGAIFSTEHLILDNVMGINNHAGGTPGLQGDGGFLAAFGSSLSVSNSMFQNNTSADDGGAVFFSGGTFSGNVSITDSVVSGNSAGVDGLGAYVVQPSFQSAQGGGLYLHTSDGYPGSGNITIDGTTINGNLAAIDGSGPVDTLALGGGLSASASGTLQIVDSTISGNRTATNSPFFRENRGGGVFLQYGGVIAPRLTVMDNVQIENNQSEQGGGIYASPGNEIVIDNSTVLANSARSGGGIALRSFLGGFPGPATTTLLMRQSTISGNSASDGSGGGIHQTGGSEVRAYDSDFYNNYALFAGGALYANANHPASNYTLIETSAVRSNTAFEIGGGGIAARTDGGIAGNLNVRNSTLSDNWSASNGGAILVRNSTSTIFQSTVSGNTANSSGGGVHLSDDAGPTTHALDRTTITKNDAMVGSGVLAGDAGSSTLAVFESTVVAGNLSGPDRNCGGTSTCLTAFSFIGGNPGLGLLAANSNAPMVGDLGGGGVSIHTHLPNLGSPLIDAGSTTVTTGTDQNTNSRVQDGGAPGPFPVRMDIGAVEVQESPILSCDTNGDGICDIFDLNGLTAAVVSGAFDASFDLNGDGLLTLDDITDVASGWLRLAGEENLGPGRTYFAADANLDGNVDGQDFIAWNAHKFSPTGLWSMGDWNADGVTDGLDFVIWNGLKFTSSDAALADYGRDLRSDGPMNGIIAHGTVERAESTRSTETVGRVRWTPELLATDRPASERISPQEPKIDVRFA